MGYTGNRGAGLLTLVSVVFVAHKEVSAITLELFT